MPASLSLADISAISVAAVMFSLFLFSRMIEIFLHWRRHKQKREKIRRLLLYEVRLNVGQIENSITGIPPIDDLRKVFELKGDTLLVAPFTDDVFFFNDIKKELDVLDEEIFWEVMKFYSLLKSIEVYSNTVASHVFGTLSVNGKLTVVENFSEKHHEAKDQGYRVISLLRNPATTTLSS